jgi:hypothetical protein
MRHSDEGRSMRRSSASSAISSGSHTICFSSSSRALTPLGVISKPSRYRALTLPDVP